MTNSPARAHFLAHIASQLIMINNDISTFFNGGVFKGLWNPNTSPNQLPALSSANDIFLVSHNGIYHDTTLVQSQLVKVNEPTKPLLIYEKILPVQFFISVVDFLLTNVPTDPVGGSYKGELSLTPIASTMNAIANSSNGCTLVTAEDGTVTVTPEAVLIDNGGIAGFSVSATGVLIDSAVNGDLCMSFIWPNLSIAEVGHFMLTIHDAEISAADMFRKVLVDHALNAYASVVYIAHSGATSVVSYQNTYSGTGAATNGAAFVQPVAGTRVYLRLNQLTGAIQISDFNDGIGAGSVFDTALAPFPVDDLPADTTLTLSLVYAVQGATTTLLAPLVINFGDDSGVSPAFQQSGGEPTAITFPEGTIDGDTFLCTGDGDLGTQSVKSGDYFQLIADQTDCIVTPSIARITAMIAAAMG